MPLKVLPLLFFLLLLSCNEPEHTTQPSNEGQNSTLPEAPPVEEPVEGPIESDPPSEDPSPPPTPVKPVVCYPGVNHDFNLCFELNEVNDPEGNYEYPEPVASNGFPANFLKAQYRSPLYYIDLNLVDSSLALSSHFLLAEFMSPQKGRYAIYSPKVVEYLQSMRNHFSSPLIITSAYRSPGYNSSITGSAKWSRHTYGDAVDFYVKNAELNEIRKECENNNSGFALQYKTHVHCDWRQLAVEEEFFGPMPSPTLISTASYRSYSEKIKLVIEQKNKKIYFSLVDLPLEDDPADLIYDWSITLPTGQLIVSDKSKVKIKYQKGEHKVSVLVGGTLKKHFVVQLD